MGNPVGHTVKKEKTILIICSAIALMFTLLIMGLFMVYRKELKDYFSNSVSCMTVPGISEGFIPQGLAYDSDTQAFFISGYMGNGKQSPVYVLREQDGIPVKRVDLLTEDGSKFKGHAGGVSVYGDGVFIAGSTQACVYYFPAGTLLNAENGANQKAAERISLRTEDDFIRASFTSVDDSYLYIGEFHKGFVFYTHKSHLVEHDGIRQKAYLAGFRLSGNGQLVPACVFSIPDDVQGACFAQGHVFLSQSHGFLPSSILSYSLSGLEQAGTKRVLGQDVPLYVLSEHNATKKTKVPPMSEEITIVDGNMYILYEAAANRYRIGKKLGLDKIYATPLDYFL